MSSRGTEMCLHWFKCCYIDPSAATLIQVLLLNNDLSWKSFVLSHNLRIVPLSPWFSIAQKNCKFYVSTVHTTAICRTCDLGSKICRCAVITRAGVCVLRSKKKICSAYAEWLWSSTSSGTSPRSPPGGLPKSSSQNSFWDCYGSFDEQRLFSVKFARFRNFFDFAQIWGILEFDKLWEIQCWRVADGKDESW